MLASIQRIEIGRGLATCPGRRARNTKWETIKSQKKKKQKKYKTSTLDRGRVFLRRDPTHGFLPLSAGNKILVGKKKKESGRKRRRKNNRPDRLKSRSARAIKEDPQDLPNDREGDHLEWSRERNTKRYTYILWDCPTLSSLWPPSLATAYQNFKFSNRNAARGQSQCVINN